MNERAHWILCALDAVEQAGDWPVVVAAAFAAGVLLTLLVTGHL
jgi:hypothetical protein